MLALIDLSTGPVPYLGAVLIDSFPLALEVPSAGLRIPRQICSA